MERKYEFTGETLTDGNGDTIHQIRAVRSFNNIKEGDIGGYIRTEENLSHEGNCWISNLAMATGNSMVKDDAVIGIGGRIYDFAVIDKTATIILSTISGYAHISDVAVYESVISGNTTITGKHLTSILHVFAEGDIEVKSPINDNYMVIPNDTIIKSEHDYLYLPIGERGIAFIRNSKDDKIHVSSWGLDKTLDEFEEYIKTSKLNKKIVTEYELGIKLAKIHFDINYEA